MRAPIPTLAFILLLASSATAQVEAFSGRLSPLPKSRLPRAQPRGAEPREPRELYRALNAIRVDPAQVYFVRDLQLRRDVVRISLAEGKLALLTGVGGRVTGAVFTGSGRVLAVPRDPIEKRSLARFLGTPLLDEGFSRAYFRFTDQAADELRRQIEQLAAQPIREPSFADEWNPLVANLNPWHSLRILADWLAEDPRTYFYAGLVGNQSGAFDVLLDNRRDEQVLIGQPRWVSGVRYYDAWASFPLGDPPARGSSAQRDAGGPPEVPAACPEPCRGATFAPLAYTIETTIQADRGLEGRTVLRLKALRSGERMIPLELSRNLTVESVTDADGTALVYFQNEELSRQEIAQRGNDSLFVVLPEAVTAGDEFSLRFSYRGSVISDAGNGVYFVGERGSWYPHVGGSDHFVPFDLSFRWPRRLQLLATGKKLEEREEGDWRIGRWKSEAPIPVAGFNLGEYVTSVVDAGAWKIELAANRSLEQVLLERFARPVVLSSIPRGAPIPRPGSPPPMPRILVPEMPPPSPASLLKQLGADLADAIRFYEKFNGPFPFERLAVAQIPGSFGQGWPGLLYLSTLSFLSPEAQQRAGIGRRTQEHFTELIPFHEVAHQWWGNVVGWSSYRDQWIQEGLTNYITLLYADSKRPNDRELVAWLDTYRRDLTSKDSASGELPDEAGPLILGYRLRSSKSPGAYTQVVYGKGSWVFHMLRTMLREPGAKNPDARFVRLLRSLLEGRRYRGVTTADLVRAVEKLMTPAMDLEGSRSMDWFFDQWVRSTGIPRYSVEFTTRPHPTGFLIRGKLKQRGVPETFIAGVPLYAGRTAGKPALLGTLVTSGAETSFQFVSSTRPRRILIDPNLTLLCIPE